ncbi:ComF family protein [Martelella endophytica]|uniref:Amidophosphoribosyltransferase n=1 Tax=Martelella endophytica TaxID=1486262 RepID=A0A0D5LP99_MAREN|nr:ComF family protein [Martelella endophytica]AJY45941.1 amidophosphoribosyltransferase [Martelella endophytica]
MEDTGPAHSRLARPAALARGALTFAGELLFPPICAACGRTTGSHNALCTACWSDIRFIERPFCAVLGTPFSHDLGDGIMSAEAIAHPPDFDRLRSAAYFNGTVRNLVHALKYRDNTHLAVMMASWMLRAEDGMIAGCDAIAAIPLHRNRMLARRFNQSAELARNLARQSGKPFLPGLMRRTRPTAHQVGLTRAARADNVRGAFALAPNREDAVFGKRIVLVDDVYTTGATVSAVARLLKRKGAADVSVLTFARVLDEPI